MHIAVLSLQQFYCFCIKLNIANVVLLMLHDMSPLMHLVVFESVQQCSKDIPFSS